MHEDAKGSKAMETQVERYEVVSDTETGFVKPVQEPAAMGTVTITNLDEIFLIPAPSADPRGSWSQTSSRPNVMHTDLLIRPTELVKVSQDPLHRVSVNLLRSGSLAGFRFRRSFNLVHTYLCCSRSYIWSVILSSYVL